MNRTTTALFLLAAPLGPASAQTLGVSWVTDSTNDSIYRLEDLDNDGTYNGVGEVVEVYSDVLGTVSLTNNNMIAVDANGVAYVGDSSVDVILAFADNDNDGEANDPGEHWIYFDGTPGGNASGIVMDSAQRISFGPAGDAFWDGKLLIASANAAGSVDEIFYIEDLNNDGDCNDAGEAVSYFIPLNGGSTADTLPTDVMVGLDGNVYYLEIGSTGFQPKGIYKLVDADSSGSIDPLTEVSAFYVPPTLANTPFFWGFDQAPDGSFYMADSTNELIWRFRDDNSNGVIDVGVEDVQWWNAPGSSLIWEVDVAADGSVYCAESQSPDRVLRMADDDNSGTIDPVTEVQEVYNNTISGVTIGNPRGIEVVGPILNVGTKFCFCDGSGTAAPCGNPGGPDAGCANGASASGASLDATGAADIANDTLVLVGSGLVPNQPGLYFQGDNAVNGGLGNAFGDGLRCAGQNVVRLQVVSADASGNSATSVVISTKGGVLAGDRRYYQLWYRDPAGSPCGAFFNLTNGYDVTW
ncbi:MAG: hypothetical protein H6828_07515 [Planctomycetes bacterium]|nr:hypothetical protein [Planctomycetota bacterium]